MPRRLWRCLTLSNPMCLSTPTLNGADYPYTMTLITTQPDKQALWWAFSEE